MTLSDFPLIVLTRHATLPNPAPPPTEAWFLFLTTSRWLAVRLDGICSLFVTITTFGCVLLRDRETS